MAAVLTDVADAVATLIASTVTAAGGTTVRVWVPQTKVEDLAAFKAKVVPRTTTRTRTGRKLIALDHAIEIGIQKRTPALAADVDAAVLVAETLAAYLEDHELGGSTGARLVTVVVVAMADPGHLETLGVTTAVLTATYRTARQGT